MPRPARCKVPGCSIFAVIPHDHVFASQIGRLEKDERKNVRTFQLSDFGKSDGKETHDHIANLVKEGLFELSPGKERTYQMTALGEARDEQERKEAQLRSISYLLGSTSARRSPLPSPPEPSESPESPEPTPEPPSEPPSEPTPEPPPESERSLQASRYKAKPKPKSRF